MPLYREADNLTDDDLPIPYPGLATRLYSNSRQVMIPFLGAGASLRAGAPGPSTASVTAPPAAPPAPDPAVVERICRQDLGITDPAARTVLELAISVAMRVQSAAGSAPQNPVSQRLRDSTSPPSAADLADAFAEASRYNHFEWALQRIQSLDPGGSWDRARLLKVLRLFSDLTGLGSPSPSLLEVASYYEYTFRREGLREFLSGIFNDRKTEPTKTHTAIADAAKAYIEANRNNDEAGDYLIITTNYDGLIEIALDRAAIPYAVLTVPRDDWKVDVRFSGTVREYLQYSEERYRRFREGIKHDPPSEFSALGKRAKPLVVLYKIHGDLYPPSLQPRPDSIVISDDDYVRYINQDARIGMVPAYITDLMERRDLLILGYRFADWNIRSLYRSIVEKRVAGDQRDWAVLKTIGRYERGFFDNQGINMVETTLDRFWEGIAGNRPPGGS